MTPFAGALGTRREFLRIAAASSLAVPLGGLLSACGGGDGAMTPIASSGGPATGGTPRLGGTLRIAMPTNGTAETIDPRKAISNPDLMRCYALYDTLTRPLPGGEWEPGLAEEVIPNADATRWTFKLRRGVTWHDGKQFTADDVVDTIRAGWGSPEHSLAAVLKSFIDFRATRKVDDHTVEVQLTRGLAEFPAICGGYLWITQAGTKDYNRGVGTGPFLLKSFTPGKGSVFTANKNYWESGVPYIEALQINSSFTTQEAQIYALLGGEIDIVPSLAPTLAKAHANDGRIVLGNRPGPGFDAPTMRLDMAPFSDVRVRQAMRLLPDRESALQAALAGLGTVGNDCPGQGLRYWASDLHAPYDPDRARSLLKQAGQSDMSLDLYTADVTGGLNALAVVYAEQAAQAGVQVNIKTLDTSTYYSAGSRGGTYPNRQFSMNQWSLGMPCLSFVYLTNALQGAPYNETGWGDPQSDALLYDAMSELDPGKAAVKWHAVQEDQFDRGGYTILSNINYVDAYSQKVRGVQTTSTGPCDLYNFRQGWLDV